MATTAHKLKQKPALKIFHASMLVTRAEQWWVEAEPGRGADAVGFGPGASCRAWRARRVELESMLDGAGRPQRR